jgi:hypothetical protein
VVLERTGDLNQLWREKDQVMSMPRATYCRWVVNALKALRSATPQEVYHWIKENEAVPLSELSGLTLDGENLFKKNVRWARLDLKREGVVSDREGRGVWTLA